MKRCEDCIHYGICEWVPEYEGKACHEFKDSARFVELPCSLGDIAYIISPGDFTSNYTPYIVTEEVCGISQILLWDGTPSEWGVTIDIRRYSFSSLGRTWFLDRAAAEERLEKIIYGN